MPPWSADRPQVAIRRLGFSHSMSVWPWDHMVTPLGVPRCSCFSLVWPSSGLQTTDDGHWPPSVRQPRCHLMWSASAAPRVPHPVGRALLSALACPALASPSPSAFVPLPPSASACPAAREPLPSIRCSSRSRQHAVLAPALQAFLRLASPPVLSGSCADVILRPVLGSTGGACPGPRSVRAWRCI